MERPGAEWVGGDVGAAGAAGGDFELPKPVSEATASTSEATDRSGADGVATDAVSSQPGDGAWAAPTGRPKPLHDPDPYSTPPYGEPGPWAPAPPVQHPAARSTPMPAPTSPSGTAPATPATAPGAPTLPIPSPGAPPHGTPAPGAPAPGTAATGVPAPGAPPHGTPAPGAQPSSAPAPGTAPAGAATPTLDALITATSTPTSTPLHPQPAPHPPAASEGRYDPWVAALSHDRRLQGPLQQTGAGVLTEQRRRRRGRRLLVAWSLVIAVVSGGIGGVAGAWVERARSEGEVRLPQPGRVPAGRAPDSVAGIAARALPSVVTLHVSGTDQADTGTGFVLDTQGHILTNNHVVAPAGSTSGAVSVTFSSGDTVKAKIVGRDSGYDLAVVQVHGVRGLAPLPLGNSDDVRVGDPVVAIGSPYDLANTVTSGIISAKERPITAGGEKGDGSDVSYVDALQTDAPINPGNSGGPLLDSRARVIGINSAIRSADGGTDPQSGQAGSIGLGFAIPVNQARRVAEELIEDGHATHPVIGVTLDMAYTGDGARIDSHSAGGGPAVRTGGPGDRAGLAAGDVITAVDGQRVHTAEELIVKIRAHRPGDRLRLTVRRDGTDREIRLRLGAAAQN
ncbi:trypsin-like peptidase domain-containing protein [Streptomyces sp. NBC_00557]|uniref:S1C family serine protease n=1 Tax=Streptomyces sp. NBC_00557 TaxID=2975776 RepID=UPI003FCC36B8